MGILLSFVPFMLFVLTERMWGVTAGLVSAAVVAAALMARNVLSQHKTAKVLEIGTVLLFGVLAVCACLSKATWSLVGVRTCVDGGLLLVVLVSIALRQPFTLQYAREQTAPELWNKPEFVRVNYILTAAWALAFAVMVTADLILLYTPRLPVFIGITATVVAIFSASFFMSWYPAHRQHLLTR